MAGARHQASKARRAQMGMFAAPHATQQHREPDPPLRVSGALQFYLSVTCLALNFKMTALAALQRTHWRAEPGNPVGVY